MPDQLNEFNANDKLPSGFDEFLGQIDQFMKSLSLHTKLFSLKEETFVVVIGFNDSQLSIREITLRIDQNFSVTSNSFTL